MKRSRKTLFALLLALVMTLGLAATAWATEVVPTDKPFNLGLTITKIVEQKGNVAPPAETFTFVLEDGVKEGEKHNPEYYGITLEKLEIPTATGNKITKTFAVQIDPGKVNAENGWHGYGNNTPSAPIRWYSKTFLLTEQNDGKAGWQYSAEEYAVTFQYTIEDNTMDLTIHVPGNDVYFQSAEFTNSYTENLRTVEVPFTKTVKLGGNTAPGRTDFTIAVCDVNAHDLSFYPNVKYTATVTTTGAGDYVGKLIISGPATQVDEFISEGFFVREVNDKRSGWTYSDVVWFVSREGKIFPARMETTDNGDFYDAINNADAVGKMTFENIYTHNRTTPAQRPTEKPNTPETTISSPKTFDAGVALYGVSALLSLTGAALVIKRKNG